MIGHSSDANGEDQSAQYRPGRNNKKTHKVRELTPDWDSRNSTVSRDRRDVRGRLDPDFQIRSHAAKFFITGRVFQTLWHEPYGGHVGNSHVYDHVTPDSQYGEPIFSKPRRFVVVRRSGTYCTALSINTYGGQGVAKNSVEKWQHCIIHTGETAPPETKAEQERSGEFFAPIRTNSDSPIERLNPLSRLDFGRTYTIEFNSKVKSFGMVHPHSMKNLVTAFCKVMLDTVSAWNITIRAPSSYADACTQTEAMETNSEDERDELSRGWQHLQHPAEDDPYQTASQRRESADILSVPDEPAIETTIAGHAIREEATQTTDEPAEMYPCRFEDCQISHKPFVTLSDRKRHETVHHGKDPRPHACEICASRFDRKVDLRRHESSIHGRHTLMCPKCFKTFSRKDNLKRHKRNCHVDVAPAPDE